MDMRYFGGQFPCMEPGAAPGMGQFPGYGPGYGAPSPGYAMGPGFGMGYGYQIGPPINLGLGPGETGPDVVMCPAGTTAYRTAMGDTVSSVARMMGVSVQDILAMNPGLQDGSLVPGQTICVPRGMPCDGKTHIISAGETLEHIAHHYGISMDDLLRANPMLNPGNYRAGDRVCIPHRKETDGEYACMMYTVEHGDTLCGICIKCNTSVDVLRYGNPGINLRQLVPGTRLRICPTPCESSCKPVRKHVIPRGMDLVSCSRALGVSMDALLMANPSLPPCRFTGGTAICLPDS